MILALAGNKPSEAEVIARWSVGKFLLALEVHIEQMNVRKGAVNMDLDG